MDANSPIQPNGNGNTLRAVLICIGVTISAVALWGCAMAIKNSSRLDSIEARLRSMEMREETNRTFDRLAPQRYAHPPSERPDTTESIWR